MHVWCIGLLLELVGCTDGHSNEKDASHVVVKLRQPWPPSLGRISRIAAIAARQAHNETEVEFVTTSDEWGLMLASGASVELVHENASAFYAERAAVSIADATWGRSIVERRLALQQMRRVPGASPAAEATELRGSMGGYFTYSEVEKEMDRLANAYPQWLGRPIQVGRSRLGNPIYMWCMTQDLEGCAGESHRPAVLYTALVHSREPATVMCLVQMMRALLRDADLGQDSARFVLANRKLLVLPVANPDGYLWNEMHRRAGGGMKRKNGASTCNQKDSENDGVDLNRNFGFKYAYDSIGSSPQGVLM